MHIHIVGVAGTGMGSLAGLLAELGHQVSGSDVAFDPPMGPALAEWGVQCLQGFAPEHLVPAPDLVVIGNVCRPSNVEARAAIDQGLPYTHIAGALSRFVLEETAPLVVAGTHGKTTTASIAALLLERTGFHPGYLIGGLPNNFPRSFHAPGRRRLHTELTSAQRRTPFVLEGDEYDTAFFEKTAKFLHYRPEVAIVTSIEHDHIDIYPTLAAYVEAFQQLVQLVPEHGLIIANGADANVRRVVRSAKASVAFFALQGEDTGDVEPHWLAAPAQSGPEGATFDLFAGGVACGRFALRSSGRHNLKNALAAVAAAAQGYGAKLHQLGPALAEFAGVKRRQEVLSTAREITVYDDFAHHPSAVRETLAALSERHPGSRLIAVFEPRSATACRKLHQESYATAFAGADIVLLAPLGRADLPASEALDLERLAREIGNQGKLSLACTSLEQILERLSELSRPGDVVALLSNGSFGGMTHRVVERLALEPGA
ncbi:MAG TPA: Mur ligase family protein [Polyangiaceae bacterium]|nr:Mur ligase family protein [Polyangiaceae bacterium]